MSEKEIDLDNPKDARKFLRGVRIAGKPIEFVVLESDKHLGIEDMTDDQAIEYAKDIYFDYCGGIEGARGSIELEGIDQ